MSVLKIRDCRWSRMDAMIINLLNLCKNFMVYYWGQGFSFKNEFCFMKYFYFIFIFLKICTLLILIPFLFNAKIEWRQLLSFFQHKWINYFKLKLLQYKIILLILLFLPDFFFFFLILSVHLCIFRPLLVFDLHLKLDGVQEMKRGRNS